MELAPERRVDPLARLVAGPELVAERLDHVVGRHAEVGGAALQHAEHRSQDPDHPADLVAPPVRRSGDGVEMPEELVGPVDEMHAHPRG